MLEGKKVCNPGILISGDKRVTKFSIKKKKIKLLHFFLWSAASKKERGQRWPRS